MELSGDDVKRLEDIGYSRGEFTVLEDHTIRLRNVGGWCYFYDSAMKNCRVYENRPLGCYLYPVVHLDNEGAIVDDLCPMGHTISEQELRTKGKILDSLLTKIDDEGKRRQ
jgi:Fe-S-cluster containining protein